MSAPADNSVDCLKKWADDNSHAVSCFGPNYMLDDPEFHQYGPPKSAVSVGSA